MIDRIAQIHHLEGRKVNSVNGRNRAVSVTPALIGAAANGHVHAQADINGLAATVATITNAAETVHATAKATATLQEGVSVIPATTSGIADVEIAGRTLVSLGNSNLEAGKKYVIADPKTKVVVDKNTVSGVGKFLKGSTTKTVADFAGKVAGSNVANPHFLGHLHAGSMNSPTAHVEFADGYFGVSKLDGNFSLSGTKITVGGMGSHVFGFNVIEQVERTIGLIPKNTVGEKLQWLKDNVESFIFNWNGYGISATGNKATVLRWNNAVWTTPVTHQFSVPTAITYAVTRAGGTERPAAFLETVNNGFIYFMAHAEPTDGVTASYITTNYASLEIQLKPTAQLNTRPRIIRVENFEGKVAGSTVENPHVFKWDTGATLALPSVNRESIQADYDRIKNTDGITQPRGTSNAGAIAQQLFSFNIIKAVEESIGKIPASDTTGKVAWLRVNVDRLKVNWSGYGSSPTGNKITLSPWATDAGNWYSFTSHKISSISPLTYNEKNWIRFRIDDNGFNHILIHTDPSDGTIPSTVYTDYIELEIELKPTANFHAPRVPLYEVDDASYNNILAAWSADEVIKRYPVVEGMQHLTNPYVMAEGDNVFDLTKTKEISTVTKLPTGFRVDNFYANNLGTYEHNLLPNTQYSSTTFVEMIKGEPTGSCGAIALLNSKTGATFSLSIYGVGIRKQTFTAPPDIADFKTLLVYGSTQSGAVVEIRDIMLTLGSEPKPFVPRNPSYLYVQEKLGAIGDKKDVLFKEDGKWKVRKSAGKEIIMDGSLAWNGGYSKFSGFRRIYTANVISTPENYGLSIGIKYDGSKLRTDDTAVQPDRVSTPPLVKGIYLSVLDSDTGFPDVLTPSSVDWKRYFNGWKYTNGTTWTSVTGNGQTATAQQALDTKPTDYTPYKLSYVLANPVIEEVSVEGDLKVDGLTQVEVGSGMVIREELLTIGETTSTHYINDLRHPSSLLKCKAQKILDIQVDGESDGRWLFNGDSNSNGSARAYSNKDGSIYTGRKYTVTYIALGKHKLTTNISDTKFRYPQDFTTSFRDLVTQAEDVATRASVNKNAMLDAFIELQALKGGG